MYSTIDRPNHISGSDLNDIKTKLYYEQLLGYLASPTLHYALDLQPHQTIQNLQCGFYTNNSRLILYIPVCRSFSLSEIMDHIRNTIKEQWPELVSEAVSNSCVTDFTLELVREHINHKN